MQNQVSFERDTAIDIILPSLAGDTVPDIRRALLNEIAPLMGDAEGRADFMTDPDTITEELQSAGIGGGVGVTALKCPGLKRAHALLAKLKTAGPLQGPDGAGVDMLCVLFYPESESVHYLRRLSRLTRLFRNEDLCAKIRETQDVDMIHNLIQSPEGWMLAA